MQWVTGNDKNKEGIDLDVDEFVPVTSSKTTYFNKLRLRNYKAWIDEEFELLYRFGISRMTRSAQLDLY